MTLYAEYTLCIIDFLFSHIYKKKQSIAIWGLCWYIFLFFQKVEPCNFWL